MTENVTESIQVNYTRKVEDTFWFKPGDVYTVDYAKDRQITGRFVGRDEDALIFRSADRKKLIYSVRVKSLRGAKVAS